ncbi:PD-(D/E)XK nuclease family protein [Brachyspira innocens]|uniref:PD-(D/E)XK nuclease family protein n=1 Tax=Brachyspira innocens TaxID=13264 RepID=UPI000370E91E|nr:PD-(D/E)XK nuclease family protein [Brachyspira innocens]
MDNSLINFLNKYKIIETVRSKKNFFEISGFPHYEIVFNNVLAFFMNSDECHNFGNLVFTSLLEILKEKENIINIIDDHTQYVIREESTINGKLIDILIKSEHYIIGIETKIEAILNNDLEEYNNHVKLLSRQENKKSIFIVLSKTNKYNDVINISHKELADKILFNLQKYKKSLIHNKYYYFLNDFLENILFISRGVNMNKDFLKLLKDEDKYNKIENIFSNICEVRKLFEAKANELRSDLNLNIFKSSIKKPEWTIAICLSLEGYFYDNENELVIEIYINNIDDEYNIYIYFRKKGNVIKISDKLNIFLQNILYNYNDFDKNYYNDYDELNLVLKSKDELINLVKNIEMKCQEYK